MTDFEEEQFSLSEAAEAAGCPRATLDAWRNRLKLFKGTVTGTKEEKRLSLIDVCVARAVKMLTDTGIDAKTGISAKDAVAAIDDTFVRAQFFMLLRGDEGTSSVFGYHKGRDGKHRLQAHFFAPDNFPAVLRETGGTLIVVDLAAVITHVRAALRIPASREHK